MSNNTKRYAMVIDLRKCVGCHACSAACKIENAVPKGKFRAWVAEAETGMYPEVVRLKIPRLCNHCDDAPCLKVCPIGATYREEDGTILVDYDRCIGCKYCISACPYDARFINPVLKTADKCTFCHHRLEAGLMPACISSCVAQTRFFGDLNDPNCEVSKLLRQFPTDVLKPEMNTAPQVYYIGADGQLLKPDYRQALKGGE